MDKDLKSEDDKEAPSLASNTCGDNDQQHGCQQKSGKCQSGPLKQSICLKVAQRTGKKELFLYESDYFALSKAQPESDALV